MSLSKEHFTTNEVIDSISIGDPTVDIIGYVTKVDTNRNNHFAGNKYYKIVVNNGAGKQIQVIVWNKNISIIQNVQHLYSIVHIGTVMSSVIKNEIYNNGNVNFELLVKENSHVDIHGMYKEGSIIEKPLECTISEVYKYVNKIIKLQGYIKSEMRQYQSRDFDFIIGSITDDEYNLEIKTGNKLLDMTEWQKGGAIELIGTIEQNPPGPAFIRIDSIEHVLLYREKKPRVPFKTIIAGFKNPIVPKNEI